MHHVFMSVLVAMLLIGCGGGDGGGGGPSGPDPYAWQRHGANTLLTPPKSPAPATTYEVSIADPSVMFDAPSGLWKAWYSATRFDTAIAGDPGIMLIRYAESADGITWTVQAAPALQARNNATDWDYTHTETPCVIRNPDGLAPASQRWLLFYAGGNLDADVAAGRTSLGAYPYYQIGLAYSADGRTFTRCLPGLDGKPGLTLKASQALAGVAGFADGLLADPEAVAVGGQITLWCSSFAESAARSPLAFGISHATSADGLAWAFPAVNPLSSLYRPAEAFGGEQPAVLYDPSLGRYEMWFKNDSAADKALLPTLWFTAYGFWHATSPDGIAWTPDYATRDFAWEPARAYETYGLLTGCSVVRHAGYDRMFYCAWGTQGIPDPALYQVPLQVGSNVPAVITFNQAYRSSPPGAVAAGLRTIAPLALLNR